MVVDGRHPSTTCRNAALHNTGSCRNADPRRVVGMFTHTVSVTQETWDEAERVSHELKHPFQDRHGVWHYKEVAFVEQVIRKYCAMQGLTLRE